MTDYEHLMLSVCFGATIGFLIAPWVITLKDAILSRREKKHRARERDRQ